MQPPSSPHPSSPDSPHTLSGVSVHQAPPGIYGPSTKDPSSLSSATDSPVADYVSFGPGLRFYTLRYLHRTLAPSGFTLEALTQFCVLYGVPLVYLHPRIPFVEFDTFKLVLRSLVAPGGIGIPAPTDQHPPAPPSVHFTRLRDSAHVLVGELYALRKLNQLPAPDDLRASMNDAATRLALHAIQVRDHATYTRALAASRTAATLFSDTPESVATYFDVTEEAASCHPNSQTPASPSDDLSGMLWSIEAEAKSPPPSSIPTDSEPLAPKTSSIKPRSSRRSSPTSEAPTPTSPSEPSPSS